MKTIVAPVGSLRILGTVAFCILMAATTFACNGDDERMRELETKARSLEESLEALTDENAELKSEIAVLRGQLEERDARLKELEEVASKAEFLDPSKEQWSKGKEEWSLTEGTVLERTLALAEESGGEVHYVDHAGRGDRTVMVLPQEFVDGETPIIVSLHGFGGDSASQTMYVPLHESVNTAGFALLLPNGAPDGAGNQFWNPTDECCEGGKSGEDDAAYLTELVANAREIKDFGPVYFFGYSNGGFMSYHMACKGLPGLRAVASLAGTSYLEDSSCEGAPPLSVLHVHGTADSMIQYEGDAREQDSKGETAFYAGAQDMVARWGRRAGCEWPEDLRSFASLDFDQYVQGSETQVFRLESGCAEGIKIELWMGEGSGHAPGYGEAFVDALVDWLLSRG